MRACVRVCTESKNTWTKTGETRARTDDCDDLPADLFTSTYTPGLIAASVVVSYQQI